MKSSPQRIHDSALDAVDPISKTEAQNTEINLTTNPKTYHLHEKNYKRIDSLQKFHDNRNNNSTFPTRTLSFQASQQIKVGNDII